mmetsp:Transcript_22696/g.49179  ORF Transcript_22696/g.49179 Transcript_22696/m.49179 type:complete len:356 (+) Transcript_22696:390-1457(+)
MFHPQSMRDTTMASLVEDVPVSFEMIQFFEDFFLGVSCIAATAIRFLSSFLLPLMEESGALGRNVESITRCISHWCRMERTTCPSADRTSTSAVDDYDDGGDGDLFAPIPPRPECPICMLTLPLECEGKMYMSCCGNIICSACERKMSQTIEETNKARKAKDPHCPCLLKVKCPLCRTIFPENDEAYLAQLRDRMERNDTDALCAMARLYSYGQLGVQKDENKAFELYSRAAELGHSSAQHQVALSYFLGEVVEKDKEKFWRHLVVSAKGGSVLSRACLGAREYDKGNHFLAYKHWRISIAAGCDESLRFIECEFDEGRVTKDEYGAARRDYQKARDEMQSNERDDYFASLREMK